MASMLCINDPGSRRRSLDFVLAYRWRDRRGISDSGNWTPPDWGAGLTASCQYEAVLARFCLGWNMIRFVQSLSPGRESVNS